VKEFGDIREIYTKDLLPNGFCVVSYFDLGDAIRAFEKLQMEDTVVVQYCPEGYVSMVSERQEGALGILADQLSWQTFPSEAVLGLLLVTISQISRAFYIPEVGCVGLPAEFSIFYQHLEPSASLRQLRALALPHSWFVLIIISTAARLLIP